MADDERVCPTCGDVLVRKPHERLSAFKRRCYCDPSCAAIHNSYKRRSLNDRRTEA